jgi:uncharacterized protein
MLFERFGERYVVRLESGEAAIESLLELLTKNDIGFANVSAAGAIRWARLAYWNADTRKYQEQEFTEQLEVVSFQGNASLKDGKPFLHIHGVFARPDFSTLGGHVKEVRVHPTMEVWLRTEDVPVRRLHDAELNLDLLDLH